MANLLNEKEQLIDLERLYNEEQYEDALVLAKELAKEFNESIQIKLLYAKILKANQKLEQSEAILNEILASHPDNLNVLLETAALSVALNKFEQAREYYNKILFIDSFNAQAKAALEKLEGASDEPTLEVKQPEVKAEAKEEGQEDIIEEVKEELKEKVEDIIKEEVKEIIKTEIREEKPEAEKKPWKADTLPEDELDKIANLVSDFESRSDEDEVEITKDSIQVEEALHVPIKPSIPGVDEPYSNNPAPAVEEVSTEAVEDFFMEAQEESKSSEVSTEKAPDPVADRVTDSPLPPIEGEGFITESAAELYFSQGLYEESLYIYEKLYMANKEDKYISVIEDLKVKCIGQKKIQALTAFLELIERRSE